jgi:hypothetical protein
MASAKTLARIETLAWVLIYGGLLLVIGSLIAGQAGLAAGPVPMLLGFAGVFGGAVAIWVRSRLKDDTAPPPRP